MQYVRVDGEKFLRRIELRYGDGEDCLRPLLDRDERVTMDQDGVWHMDAERFAWWQAWASREQAMFDRRTVGVGA